MYFDCAKHLIPDIQRGFLCRLVLVRIVWRLKRIAQNFHLVAHNLEYLHIEMQSFRGSSIPPSDKIKKSTAQNGPGIDDCYWVRSIAYVRNGLTYWVLSQRRFVSCLGRGVIVVMFYTSGCVLHIPLDIPTSMRHTCPWHLLQKQT